jgi:hypothetical protein
MPKYTFVLDKAPRHSIDVTLLKDTDRKAFYDAITRFSKDNGFSLDISARDPQDNVIMVTMTGKNTDIIMTSEFSRVVFAGATYVNGTKPENIAQTDAMTEKFKNFLSNQLFLKYKSDF